MTVVNATLSRAWTSVVNLAPVMDAAASGARVVYLYRPQAAASCQAIVRACARAAISCRRVPGVAAFRQ